MNWAMLGDKAGLATTDLVMFAVPGMDVPTWVF